MDRQLSLLMSHNIPEDSAMKLLPWYNKLADLLINSYRARNGGEKVNVNRMLAAVAGSQGSGKSTLTAVLPSIIEQKSGLRAESFSLDDVYKSRAERGLMAENIHPLFITRGVPGTHNLVLALKTIDAIFSGKGKIPVFDKSSDNPFPESEWRLIKQPADIVIVEGWCMGCPPIIDDELKIPVNELEALEDENCIWRNEINRQLKSEYSEFFGRFDFTAFLQAPGFEAVYSWRNLQEEKLRIARPDSPGLMNANELKRFIRHFERITRQMLIHMPKIADAVLKLNDDHEIISMTCL